MHKPKSFDMCAAVQYVLNTLITVRLWKLAITSN